MRTLCRRFDGEYWRKIDTAGEFPTDFVTALTADGWLSAMIPAEYGGSGLGLAEASVILEEVNRCGGNSGTVHGQMYNMFTLVRHGSAAQKAFYLPKFASGELRLQSMAVTEPTSGTDTSQIKTTAVKQGDHYVVNGQKVWTSLAHESDWCFVVARTDPDSVAHKGLGFFLVSMHQPGVTVRPIEQLTGTFITAELENKIPRVVQAFCPGRQRRGRCSVLPLG